MKVTIETPEGIVWMCNIETGEGMTSTGYVKDGTQQKIVAALEEAIFQAKGQYGLVDNVN
ncbi:Rrf2 family transcriptional regulator [Serratia bockelmannii]|uniref:Rrf2 family transcriptional regulator n=1 Tax=Serratia bockelmannii TaxID=2703793 RepID=UPI003FA75720